MNFQTDILPLKDKLFRMALRITMQREEAEDVVQEVLIKLWNQRDSLREIVSLESYAITITRNLSLDHLRRAGNKTVSMDGEYIIPERSVNPYDSIYAQEGIRRIHALLAELPEKQRSCMQLRDFEGKNYREIADIMGITEDQVKVNIFRARKYIKEHLKSPLTP